MKKFLFAVACAALVPAAAFAQDTAPDGSSAFGIEPYVGVLGGYHSFDRTSEFGDRTTNSNRFDGALISGVAGVNIPLGPIVAGVEGNVGKGFSDIDWEYGVKGKLGFRAGDSGMIYGSAGYQWVNGKAKRGFSDQKDMIYGIGLEVGPKDIGLGGITGEAGPRLRLQMDTYDFDSIRPMAGVVFHF